MAININFLGASLRVPGIYGDPSAIWWQNNDRKPLLMFLAKLGIRSATHYTYYSEIKSNV